MQTEAQNVQTISIEIPRATLRALLVAAAVKDVRYYLNGVALIAEGAQSVLVSTNGHFLLAHNFAGALGHRFECIIPRDVIDQLLKVKHSKKHAENPAVLTLPLDFLPVSGFGGFVQMPRWARFDFCGLTFGFKPIEGRFPDWRRVVPASASGQNAQFAPHLLDACADAMRIIKNKGKDTFAAPYVHHNGNDSALVELDADDWLAVVMPCRSEGTIKGAPTWARASSATEFAAKAA